MGSTGPVHEGSEGKVMVWNWATGHLYYLLVKYMTDFCLCPENLSEAESKSNRSSCLVEKISKWHDMEATAWVLFMEATVWVLLFGVYEIQRGSV